MYKESRIVMDTFCTITVVSPSRKEAKEAIEAGFTEIKRLERLLNFFSADSEVTALNRASGREPVKVSRDTLDVIKKAVEIANYTDGAFDPTIGPLMRLWGFESQNPKPSIPLENKIKDALRFVDYKKIKINDLASQIFLEEKGMEIDLGGIAKGYAADRAIEVIKAKGIKAALVAIAGD
ncbi:MAG: FAD:protein FMN transferase, partial [Nitrospirota bacterium]